MNSLDRRFFAKVGHRVRLIHYAERQPRPVLH
jgi:hypothetical protein